MASFYEKSSDKSRALLFELLVDCRFITCTNKDCPIWEQRNNLSIEKKHEYAMRLSDEEIKSILVHYECSYDKRLSDLNKW